MAYKVIVKYLDTNGAEKTESAILTAMTDRDAEFQRKLNQEIAEKKYGKENVINVELVEE